MQRLCLAPSLVVVALAVLFLATSALAQCNTGLKNISLPDNGNVCELLSEPDLPETTCMATIGGGLNGALAACADDTYIEITLSGGFDESGPFVFPDVRGITIIGSGGGGGIALRGARHVVVGNETALEFRDLSFLGDGTEDQLFFPPLRSNNLTLARVFVGGFHGPWTVQQEACTDDTRLDVSNSYFFDNWGASLFHAGLQEYSVRSNVFDRCGGNQYGATFLKTNFVNQGTHVFFNNSQWVLFDEQPPLCITFLDGGEHTRCRDGVFECEDLTATVIADDCPRTLNKTFIDPATNNTVWELLFEPFCRRYAPCQCEQVIFRDASNVSVADFVLRVGDIIYPFLTLPCQPGTDLVAGGAVGSVAPLQFNDPSFELGNNPIGNDGWLTFGNVIRPNSETRPKSRTGDSRVICNGKEDAWFQQLVNFTEPGAYLVSFWGARRDGQRDNYAGGFVEVYLDGMQVSSIGDPTFEDTLVGDLTYYEFIFPSINVAVAGVKMFRVRCNFVATDNLEFAIDDIQSRQSGLEIVLFPPGQGNGPPPLSDPINFIAQPLATDSFIEALPCPPCPDPPDRPPNLPCNYNIASGFTCFSTVFNGTLVCLEPDLFNVGGGAIFLDPSMELLGNNTVWIEVPSPGAIQDEGATLPAFFGSRILFVENFDIVSVEQPVNFTQSGLFTVTFYGLRGDSLFFYPGKLIKLYIDNVLVDTLTSSDIGTVLPFDDTYALFFFATQAVMSGVRNVRIELDWSGGPFGGSFAVDQIQFLNAFASPSASQTPTPSVSPSPAPIAANATTNLTATLLCQNPANASAPLVNITVPCFAGYDVTLPCNGTNITVLCTPPPPPVFPLDLLRCVEEIVYLGDEPFMGGCIVPGNLTVEFQGSNITANECLTTFSGDGCVLPEMFVFDLNGTLIDCVSLEFGIMRCDCSTEKLLPEFLDRDITPGTCAYEFDNIPRTAKAFFIRENRAQQLDFGGCSRRIEYDTVAESSVAPVDWFDEKGVAREILKQSNTLWGRIPDAGAPGGVRYGPRFLQDGLSIYEEICEDNCPLYNPTVPGTNIQFCIVDQTGADFVEGGSSNLYATIQEAIVTSQCSRDDRGTWARESENFYEEDLEIRNRDDIFIFGSDNATIIGTHRIIGTVNRFLIRSLRWVHNGRNGQPQFDIDDAGDLNNLTVYNCDFSGNGVKDGGVIRNRGRRIRDVDFRYNTIRDYQTTALRFDALNLRLAHNTFEDCSGRLVQVRYEGVVRLEHNVFINSRGATDIKKPAMFELRFRGRRDEAPCNVAPELCAVRRIHQVERAEDPEQSEDFKETGVLLVDGAFFIQTIRDLVIIKARTGLRLRKVELIVDETLLGMIGVNEFLEVLQFYNPLVRPPRFRREPDGEDFMIDGFFEGSRFSRISCSFPDCVPESQQPKRCVANLNFDSFYSNQVGWEVYTNTTQASIFCPLDTVNVTTFGGARLIPERLGIRRPFSNNVLRPLLDEPTNLEIVLGDAPVPDRFTIQGIPVEESQLGYYASLLDANRTYGFGFPREVQVGTDLTCICQAEQVLVGFQVPFWSINCTDIVDLVRDDDAICVEAIGGDTNVVSCTVGTDADITCVQVDTQQVGIFVMGVYQCQLPVQLVLNVTYFNATLNSSVTEFVPETRYVVRQNLGDLTQCVFFEEAVFGTKFSNGTLNLCDCPSYYSVGGNFRSLNMTLRDLCFDLHFGVSFEDDEIEQAMFASVEPCIDIRLERVKFDGLGVEPPTRMEALRLEVGIDVPETLGRKQRNQRPFVPSIWRLDNCSFSNFLFFETTLNNVNGSALEQDEVFEFPYIVAVDVEFVNKLDGDATEAYIMGSNFTDIDRTAVRVRYANYTLAQNNLGRRSGGRSLDTPATYWFEANSRSVNAAIYLVHNNFTQTRPVTFPFLGDLTVPAYQALVWVTGLRDQAIFDCTQTGATIDECLANVYPSCCPALVIVDNFWCGLPYALRIVGERDVMNQYILANVPGMPEPIFDDDLSALREIALVNQVSIDGTVCDIVLGPPDQDWREEHLCCEESCAPRAPSVCRVNSTDPVTLDVAHPWYDIYLFDDINRCMELCQASSRQCNVERPSNDAPYEVRIVADVLEPPILQYRATWSGPVFITVADTFPMSGLVSPPAVIIPIEWDDASLPAVMVEIVLGDPLFESISIVVKGRLQMPPGIAEDVTTPTPAAWLMDIEIVYTFCTPGNMVAPVPSFPVLFNYTSPAINVNTPSFDYAAVLVVNWTWDATAVLTTSTGTTLNGIGLPELECNGHSPTGADITVQNVKFLHGDPCVDGTLDVITCPCTTPGLATWDQSDATPAPGLRLRDNSWDGRGYAALAIDGEYWNRTDVRTSTFIDYRASNPGYVVRIAPSSTQDCCTDAGCQNEFYVVRNTFLGQDGVAMTGNLVRVGPTEFARINKNTAIDAGAQDTVHPEAALFYVQTCPGGSITGSMSENTAERTSGVAIQTRVPPNDCYWTVAEADELSLSGAFAMERNVQLLAGTTDGAPICLRPINWPKSSPSSDCQKAVRDLRAANPQCDGTLADVWIEACDRDVCLARLLGCPGVDPACDAVGIPPCDPNDECSLCNGKCGRPLFDPPLWFLVASALLVSLLLCCFLCCCGCLLWLCCMAWPYKIVTRVSAPSRTRPITTLDEREAMRQLVSQQQ